MYASIFIIALAVGFVSAATYDVLFDCIPLTQCSKLHKLAIRRKNAVETIKLLRHSHCGFASNGQPMVWCSEVFPIQCKIPDNKSGSCIDIDQCDSFNGFITNENDLVDLQSYLYNPTCTALNDRYVCCPTDDSTLFQFATPSTTDSNNLPDPEKRECGLQDVPKIFGGKNTQFEEFPWTVQLQYRAGTELTRNCGGTLISNRYVVTAAHCVDRAAIRAVGSLVSVVLGEYDTRNATDCINMLGIQSCADPHVTVPVENIIIHPNWYNKPPATIDHDIALLRLADTVKFTQYIRPICLPTATKTFEDGERLTVSGWGQTETARTSPVKLKTSVPVNNKDQCKATYKTVKRLIVGDGEFCVVGEDGIDSCTGDSGGPLMYSSQPNGDSIWYLAGVVSFGPNQPCGVKNYPGLYTYLPKYVGWIQTTVKT